MMSNTPHPPAGGLARRILVAIVILGLIATGCGASAGSDTVDDSLATDDVEATESSASPDGSAVADATADEPTPAPQDTTPPEPTAEPEADPTAAPTASPAPTPTVEFGDALPPAAVGVENLVEQEPAGPQPVSIAIEDIEVVDASVIPVGVNPDQTFEVPPADQVGWYRFGPAPGDEGSAVLAAHIAFNGVDGVFRHLADVEVGSVVVIGFDDGSTSRYRIETVTEYLKEELPADLFARDGNTQLALITCGGDFNRQLDSYDSNVVAVAVPI